MSKAPGDRIGRYIIDRRLGVGGMAEAYLTHAEGPSGFRKPVVVKVLLSQFASDKARVELFLREARVGARLNHANIVQIFDLGAVGGEEHIAMEYVDGLTLLQATRRMWAMGVGIPMDIALRIIAGAAVGLHYAHTLKAPDGSFWGVIHRDISPDNLIIARDGTVKILDFGVAKLRGSEATQSGEVKGKIPFMSPEQLDGSIELDARSDLWALGVTLYWCLCGRRPFTGPGDVQVMRAILDEEPVRPSMHNKAVPQELDDLVMNLLEKDRELRIASASKLAARLQRLVPPTQGSPLAKFIEKLSLYDDDPPEAKIATGSIKGLPAGPAVADSTDLVLRDASNHAQLMSVPKTDGLPATADVTLGADELPAPGSDTHVTATVLVARDRAARRSRRPQAVAAAAGLALLTLFAVTLVTLGGDDEARATLEPTPAPVAPPALAVADDVEAAPADDAVADAVVADDEPAPDVAAPDRARVVRRGTKSVVVVAPARIKWTTVGGRALGAGSATLQVPDNDKTIVAVDSLRDGRITVAVAPRIEWSSLREGKLLIRVLPYATDVRLGSESLGPTPLAPKLVVTGQSATYRVVVMKDKQRQGRFVKIKPGEEAVVAIDLRK